MARRVKRFQLDSSSQMLPINPNKKVKDQRIMNTDIGYPCKFCSTVGRIVALSPKGKIDLLLSDTTPMHSIVIFSSPFGCKQEIGTIHLYELDQFDMDRLISQENDMKEQNRQLYAGMLDSLSL